MCKGTPCPHWNWHMLRHIYVADRLALNNRNANRTKEIGVPMWRMVYPISTEAPCMCKGTGQALSLSTNFTSHLRGEWPSGLSSSCHRSSEVKLWMGDLGGLISQLTFLSFGRDVKLGIPCLDAA